MFLYICHCLVFESAAKKRLVMVVVVVVVLQSNLFFKIGQNKIWLGTFYKCHAIHTLCEWNYNTIILDTSLRQLLCLFSVSICIFIFFSDYYGCSVLYCIVLYSSLWPLLCLFLCLHVLCPSLLMLSSQTEHEMARHNFFWQ